MNKVDYAKNIYIKKSLSISHRTEQGVIAALPVMFYFVNLIRLMGHDKFAYVVVVAGLGVFGLLLELSSDKLHVVPLTVLLLYCLTGFINAMFIGNLSAGDILSDIFFFGIAYLMLLYPWSYKQGFVAWYLLMALFLRHFLSGRPASTMLTSSGNYVSILLLLNLALYYLALEREGRAIRLWDLVPAISGFCFAVWANGRGGILACSLVMAFVVGLYLVELIKNHSIRILIVIVAVIGAITVFLLSSGSFSDWFMSLGKWEERGFDNSARMQIWKGYFDKVAESPSYFFFGAPLLQIPAVLPFDGNCHNSFIQLHAYNGVFMLACYLLLACGATKRYIGNRKWISVAFLAVICIRAFTDKFIFSQYGMPIMLYLIFRPYISDRFCRARRNDASHEQVSD